MTTVPSARMPAGRDEFAALIRRAFDGLAEGDSTLLLSKFSPDATWTVAGTASTWCGTWAGRDEIMRGLLRPLSQVLRQPSRLNARWVVAAGDRVVVEAQGLNTTVDGKRYENSYCFLFEGTAGGLIGGVVEYADTALMEQALGPCPTVPTRPPVRP